MGFFDNILAKINIFGLLLLYAGILTSANGVSLENVPKNRENFNKKPTKIDENCSPVTYHFCNSDSLNYTIYTSRSVNENSEFIRSLDDYTLTAQLLYEFVPLTDYSFCLLRWKKLICSAWFPNCATSGKNSPVVEKELKGQPAEPRLSGQLAEREKPAQITELPICRETCDNLMQECSPETALNELFKEKDSVHDFLLKYAENFKKSAFDNCKIFPKSTENPNCNPFSEIILTRPKIVTNETLPELSASFNGNISQPVSISCSFISEPKDKPSEQYKLIRYWVLYWALVCLISSLFTFGTFLIDRSRFKYPEKATVFISFCYVMISAVYVIGFFAKTSVSCTENRTALGKLPETQAKIGLNSEVSRGLGNFGCVVSFAVQYYFLMALSIWWVVFGLAWFLAAGLKWCQDIMDRTLWFMFHGVAWGVPAVKTVFIIASKEIDGDVFTGTCFTGYSNPVFLWSLVVAPFAIYLITGFVLLLTGFVSLYLIRKEIRKEPNMSEKAERVIFRVVMFVLIYVMAAAILISVFLYEDSIRPRSCGWYRESQGLSSGETSLDLDSETETYSGCYYPSTTALIVKYFMLFIPGTLAGFWLWTPKTLSTWKNFLCFSRNGAKKVKQNNIVNNPKAQTTESKSVRVHISPDQTPSPHGRTFTDLERAILCHPMNRNQFNHPSALLNTKFKDLGSFV